MKKTLSVLLTLSLLILGICPTFAVSYENGTEINEVSSDDLVPTLYGDTDSDNKVSIKDATLIQKHTASLITLSEEQLIMSDVDGNEKVNVVDATWIQKKLASIVDEFPVEKKQNNPENTEPSATTGIPTAAPTKEPASTNNTSAAPILPTETEAATPAESTLAPTKPSVPAETTAPTEPSAPVETTTPTESSAPVETTTPTESSAPAETTTPTMPSAPAETTTPTVPSAPAETTTPTEPSAPAPTEPSAPQKPSKPSQPTKEDYRPKDNIPGDVVTTHILWQIEEGFYRLVNEERESLGLKPLSYNKELDDAAQTRSLELTNCYSHTRPNGEKYSTAIDRNKYKYTIVGENVYGVFFNNQSTGAAFTGSKEQIEAIYTKFFADFKNSPLHYSNMIYEGFADAGIGISYIWDKTINQPCFYMSHIFGTTEK